MPRKTKPLPIDTASLFLLIETVVAFRETPGFRYHFMRRAHSSHALCVRIEKHLHARGVECEVEIKRLNARRRGRLLIGGA